MCISDRDYRLQIEVEGLKNSISKNGQRVPVLVRPLEGDRYNLIYGRRRLEACRELGIKVRAIVTEDEGDQAVHQGRTTVQGNAELLSISSTDSIWNSEDEIDQGT